MTEPGYFLAQRVTGVLDRVTCTRSPEGGVVLGGMSDEELLMFAALKQPLEKLIAQSVADACIPLLRAELRAEVDGLLDRVVARLLTGGDDGAIAVRAREVARHETEAVLQRETPRIEQHITDAAVRKATALVESRIVATVKRVQRDSAGDIVSVIEEPRR